MKRLLVAAVATLIGSPALAGDRWLVYSGGEKPNRLFVAVDETYLTAVHFADKTYKLETLTVLEDANAPDWVTSDMIIDCAKQTLEEKFIQVSPRGGKIKRAPDQPAKPASNAVGRALIGFACEMGPKNSEQRMAARKANHRARGWMFMGPLTTVDVADLAWNTMWTDGKRPAGTPRSEAELEREMADLAARRQTALRGAQNVAAETVRKDKEQAESFAKAQEPLVRAEARRKREPSSVRRALDQWIGQPEAELARVWGAPSRTLDHSDKRIVDYNRQVVETIYAPHDGCPVGQTLQPVNGMNKPPLCMPMSGPASWQVTYQCTASFEFRDGKIFDYVTRSDAKRLDAKTHCMRVFGKSN